MPDTHSGLQDRWCFGVSCSGCGYFVPVVVDPSEGTPGHRYETIGGAIITCASCGRRDTYPAASLEQRRIGARLGDATHPSPFGDLE